MAISVVQTQTSTTTGSSVTVTLNSATTAGNCLVVCLAFGSQDGAAPGTVSGVTLGGAAGNFTQASSIASSGGSAPSRAAIWVDPNCAGGQTSVVVTLSTGQIICAEVYEVSGLASSSVVDKTSANENASSSTWTSNATATTTVASEIWFGCLSAISASPSGPAAYTNTLVSDSVTRLWSGYDIVSSTGAATYNGTGGGSSGWAACVVTLKSAAVATTAPYQAQATGRGKPAAVRGSGRGQKGAAYVAFPSHFTQPGKPSRGAQAAVRGKGHGAAGKYVHVIPPGPSPFTLPVRPAKGAAPARGRSGGSPGARYVDFPSAFILPTSPASGQSAARRGTSASSPGARFVLIQTSPFILPKAPARGRPGVRRGRWSAGSATGQGAPVTPRQLILVLAAKAGTDDYGNTYPQGILATAGEIEGPTLIGSDAFFYSSKTLGGLAQSITEADGTDAYGNAYISGTATYANNGTFWSAVVIDSGVVTWYMATGPGGPWTSEAGIGFSWNNLTGGGLNFTGPAGNDMTGDLTVTGSITATVTLTVNGTDVGATLANIISALSGASTSTNGLSDGTIHGTSGGASAGTAHTHGPGSFAVGSGLHAHTLPTVP